MLHIRDGYHPALLSEALEQELRAFFEGQLQEFFEGIVEEFAATPEAKELLALRASPALRNHLGLTALDCATWPVQRTIVPA